MNSMVFMYRKKTGQSSIEYITLITILLAVFITIGTYFKRGVQGRWKSAVDDLGDQYDPLTADTNITYSLISDADTRLNSITDTAGVWTFRTDTSTSTEIKSGYLQVNP